MADLTALREMFEEAFGAWYDAACSEDYATKTGRLMDVATKAQVRAMAALSDPAASREIAALRARVAELEAELGGGRLTSDYLDKLRAIIKGGEAELDAVLARVAELEADVASSRAAHDIVCSTVDKVVADREAAIRADERAQTERDIAAMLKREAAIPGGCSRADFAQGISEDIERSDYPRTGAPAPDHADDSG